MRGIVIAAGMGMRLRPRTYDTPKCMLEIAGRPLLDWTIDGLRAAGCGEIVVVTGHGAERIGRGDVTRVHNHGYRDNNILHSLMCARAHMHGPLMVSYSDIWVEPDIHAGLATAAGDMVLAADTDWQPYYEGRSDHPLGEAENLFFSPGGRVTAAGKHLLPDNAGADTCAEFLGLWKMSAAGTAEFVKIFDDVNRRLAPTEPFQHAKEWRKAYITDIISEMVARSSPPLVHRIERGWAELDTVQDLERLPQIAVRQRLVSLVSALERMGSQHEAG